MEKDERVLVYGSLIKMQSQKRMQEILNIKSIMHAKREFNTTHGLMTPELTMLYNELFKHLDVIVEREFIDQALPE